jgi:hypothetical protein
MLSNPEYQSLGDIPTGVSDIKWFEKEITNAIGIP